MYSSAKLVALSLTLWQRVNGLVAPPSWVEVIYVIPLYGVSRGLNLNLSFVGGRSIKLTDYYRAEAKRYLPDRAKTEARPCEAEARPSQLKNCLEAASSRGRCLEDYIPAQGHRNWYSIYDFLSVIYDIGLTVNQGRTVSEINTGDLTEE